jgi:hypothetical protein
MSNYMCQSMCCFSICICESDILTTLSSHSYLNRNPDRASLIPPHATVANAHQIAYVATPNILKF